MSRAYVATDLHEKSMPEMQTPAMMPPYVTYLEREQLKGAMREAAAVLTDDLGAFTYPSTLLAGCFPLPQNAVESWSFIVHLFVFY